VEAFDFPVRAWPVRLGREVGDRVSSELLADEATAGVGPGVVGHQSFAADPVDGVEVQGALEEAGDGGRLRVGVDLGVGEPAVVVDDRVYDVDAGALAAVLA
jgi:hypothetical protein